MLSASWYLRHAWMVGIGMVETLLGIAGTRYRADNEVLGLVIRIGHPETMATVRV